MTNEKCRPFHGLRITGIALFLGAIALPGHAQIIPDNTLVNPSIVNTNDLSTVITGGTQTGVSLFHSFTEFSIPKNGSAIFFNSAEIEQIFSRVTGINPSKIDGLLGSRGTADLFFINPNGIIFGDRASLDIGGSFIVSTADGIEFSDGFSFSATNPESPPLLTVSTPVGLQFGANGGGIHTSSQTGSFNLPNGETLALIGGDLTFDHSTVYVDDGRIELGSVAPNQTVTLTPLAVGWTLDYGTVETFGNITLLNTTTIDTAGETGGSIQVYGRNLTLADGSQIFTVGQTAAQVGSITIRAADSVTVSGLDEASNASGIFLEVEGDATGAGSQLSIDTGRLQVSDGGTISTNTLGSGQGAILMVRATETIHLQSAPNQATGLFSQVQRQAGGDATTGNGGNIILDTPQLYLSNGARVSTTTFSDGDAGSIRITADQIRLDGVRVENEGKSIISAIAATTENAVAGNGGPITIRTATLDLRDGAQIITSTRGTGHGGILDITASDFIALAGTAPDATPTIGRSGLFVASERQGTGNAGNLVVRSPQLYLSDRAEISANTFREGNSDQILIEVDQLSAEGGGQIRANAFRSGSGGEILIRGYNRSASNLVQLSGIGTIQSQVLESGIASRVPRSSASANAGQIDIRSDRLTLSSGAVISVSNVGAGTAGQLQLRTNRLDLNQGTITASTRSGGGAEIDLTIADLLTLSQGSNITAQAFEQGNGGNITMNVAAGFITAVADQDSNIVAKADAGNGGNIDITAQNIFGLQVQPEGPITNDIDASSRFGLDGRVTINRVDVDPSRGLVTLPSGVVDVSRLIVQQCDAAGAFASERGEFILTGRGGALPFPGDQSGGNIWEDRRSPLTQAMQSFSPDDFSPADFMRGDQTSTTEFVMEGRSRPSGSTPAVSSESIHSSPWSHQPDILDDPDIPVLTEARGWNQDIAGSIHLVSQPAHPKQDGHFLGRTQFTCEI